MLRYAATLKGRARDLRKGLTESESALWSHLRRKQLLGIQFYRQKPLGQHIVDFFAPKARLVIEVDGSQHMEENHAQRDKNRDEYLTGLGLRVLRFNSRVVLTETDAVMEVIYRTIAEQLNIEIPPAPPFPKGGINRKPLEKNVIKAKMLN
jgi:very-short-patch-repair endonuclease